MTSVPTPATPGHYPEWIYRSLATADDGVDRHHAEALYDARPEWADHDRSDIAASLSIGGSVDANWAFAPGENDAIHIVQTDWLHLNTLEVEKGTPKIRLWVDIIDGNAKDARELAKALNVAADRLDEITGDAGSGGYPEPAYEDIDYPEPIRLYDADLNEVDRFGDFPDLTNGFVSFAGGKPHPIKVASFVEMKTISAWLAYQSADSERIAESLTALADFLEKHGPGATLNSIKRDGGAK